MPVTLTLVGSGVPFDDASGNNLREWFEAELLPSPRKLVPEVHAR